MPLASSLQVLEIILIVALPRLLNHRLQTPFLDGSLPGRQTSDRVPRGLPTVRHCW